MGYWTYYLILVAVSYAAGTIGIPMLIVGIAALALLRRVLPDPVIWLRTSGRIRSLRSEVAANPANATARRHLAMLHLERRRPRAALRLLDEARQRDDDNPELLFLIGLARFRSGDAQGALEPLVQAVEKEPRLRYGEPYLVAGLALLDLGRKAEAEDALERFVGVNSSSLEGRVRLARLRAARGDSAGARAAVREALSTWGQLPRFGRRKQLGWWLRAQLARVGL